MDDVVPDRSIKRLRLDPRSLADIVEIVSRDERRAIVKLDDVKVDDPAHADAAQLASARSVDIVSYWVNPDRPTFGRRHFVYVASGPAGAQYFGDSTSPEVMRVLKDLDGYFGHRTDPPAPVLAHGEPDAADSRVVTAARRSSAPTIDDPKVILLAALIGVMLGVVGFVAGRATARPEPIVVDRVVTAPDAPAVVIPDATPPATEPATP